MVTEKVTVVTFAEVRKRVKTTMEKAFTSGDGSVFTFSERMLRLILDLPADQQRDLVERLMRRGEGVADERSAKERCIKVQGTMAKNGNCFCCCLPKQRNRNLAIVSYESM